MGHGVKGLVFVGEGSRGRSVGSLEKRSSSCGCQSSSDLLRSEWERNQKSLSKTTGLIARFCGIIPTIRGLIRD